MSISPRVERAWPFVCLVVLTALGVVHIVVPLFVVPKFEEILSDALPGKPLPPISALFFASRVPLMLIAGVWPVAGLVAVLKRHSTAIWIVSLGLCYFVALIPLTGIAFYLPLVTTTDGVLERLP